VFFKAFFYLQFGFVMFGPKKIGVKAVHKMLVKLATGHQRLIHGELQVRPQIGPLANLGGLKSTAENFLVFNHFSQWADPKSYLLWSISLTFYAKLLCAQITKAQTLQSSHFYVNFDYELVVDSHGQDVHRNSIVSLPRVAYQVSS